MARSDDAETRAARWEKEAHDLSTQVAFLQEELALVRRKLTESPRHVRQLEERLAATQAQLARLTENNERLVATLKEARAQIVTLKEEIDRLAQPPSGYGVFLARHEDGTVDVFTGGRKLRVAVSPALEAEALRRGQEVLLNDALNIVDAFGFERAGEVVMLKEVCLEGKRPRTGHLARRRGAGGAPGRHAGRRAAAGRRLAADRAAQRVRVRAHTEERGRGAGPGGGTRRRLQRHRWPRPADRADPRRGGAAVPARRPVPRAPAPAAQGHPALRPARLRQDAHRQGGGQLAGQEDRRAAGRGEAHQLLPQHQGPGAAQQVRRRDRAAHPADLPAGPGEGRRGYAGHRVLRRDGLGVPYPRLRCLLGRGEHHRPPAAVGDRRRGGPGERHRDRRVQPRGHDRPGHPAPRPARREDQDRAAGRRGGEGHLQQVHPARPAAVRGRPGRARRRQLRPAWPR